MTNGILGDWAVQESGSNTSGDYLKLSGTGPYTLATAAYTGTLSTSSSASVVSLTGTQTVGTSSAYAVKFGSGSVTTVNGALTLASGGMILNGATLAGTGSVNFGGKTGMVFAGSNTASTLAIPLSTTLGMVKFGPGTLILSGNNSSLTGGIIVNSGVLVAQNNNALGPGKSGDDVLVAAGSALELQGGVNLPAVEVSISGTGVANSGGLCSISGTNSLPGVLNLTNNLQITTSSGTLSLGPIQGSYNVTKTGTGTLTLSANSSSLFSGSITVSAGVIELLNSGALGMVGGGGNLTISNSAAMAISGNISLPAEPITIGGTGLGLGALQIPGQQRDRLASQPFGRHAGGNRGKPDVVRTHLRKQRPDGIGRRDASTHECSQ